MIPKIKIHRYTQDHNQSLGTCAVLSPKKQVLFSSVSLERGWRDNQKNVSCIPLGTYKVKLEWSNKFKRKLWEIKGVPNRSETKFHAMNYWWQLNGCIGLGRRPKHLNRDKYLDLTGSRDTMRDFHYALRGHTEAQLIITGIPGIN